MKEILKNFLITIVLFAIGMIPFFIVSSCEHKPVEGIVIGKEYEESHITRQYVGGTNGMPSYIWVRRPDYYYVKVRTADSTEKYKSISKEVYDTIKVGSYFSENKLKK